MLCNSQEESMDRLQSEYQVADVRGVATIRATGALAPVKQCCIENGFGQQKVYAPPNHKS